METEPHGRFILRSVNFISSQNVKPMFEHLEWLVQELSQNHKYTNNFNFKTFNEI
jgi:hypothetical protein